MIINSHYLNFPTQIWELQLGIPQNYKRECIKEIYRLGDSMNQTTNVKAIMSSWWIWKESKIFDLLLEKISTIMTDKLYPSLKDYDNRVKLEIVEAWSAIYKKGHFTDPHGHKPNHFSFVYYLKSNGNTPLIFSDANFHINPIDDTLIIFPSNIIHTVPIHKDEEDRICLAGNFYMTLN
jgi:hypothetical protein